MYTQLIHVRFAEGNTAVRLKLGTQVKVEALTTICIQLSLVLGLLYWMSSRAWGQPAANPSSNLIWNNLGHGLFQPSTIDFEHQVDNWLQPNAFSTLAAEEFDRSQILGRGLEPTIASSTTPPEEVADSVGQISADEATQFQAADPWLEFSSEHPSSDDVPLASDRSIIACLLSDQQNYYSAETLTLLGAGLVVGGTMANTSFDPNIHRHFQSSIRSANSDEWFESLHSSKELGNGIYTLPVMAGAWGIGQLLPESRLAGSAGTWGERSLRGVIVGAPPLLLMQQLTGGSRPTETSEGSEWQPYRDNNGISGHAFMGSIPFITAAKMSKSKGLKAMYYGASALVPLSRVNDNAHYPSQVALGWWMAYLAASAVDSTDTPNSRWKFYPYSAGEGSGMLAEFRF